MKNKEQFQLFCLIFLLASVAVIASSCGDSQGATTEDTKGSANLSAADSVKKADELYVQREDLAKLREGIKILKESRLSDVNNFEVAWKLSEYNYFFRKTLRRRERSQTSI